MHAFLILIDEDLTDFEALHSYRDNLDLQKFLHCGTLYQPVVWSTLDGPSLNLVNAKADVVVLLRGLPLARTPPARRVPRGGATNRRRPRLPLARRSAMAARGRLVFSEPSGQDSERPRLSLRLQDLEENE